jgi:hypothetical protein
MQNVELCLDVPIEVIGLIVGKKGSTILKIQESSHAMISQASNTLSGSKKLKRITIHGTDSQAKNAQDQILGIIIRWCEFEDQNFDLLPEKIKQIVIASKSKKSQRMTGELLIPRACIKFVAGENYNNIMHLEQSSGAQIFPQEAKIGDNPEMVRIEIVGNEQAVSTARSSLCQVSSPFFHITLPT